MFTNISSKRFWKVLGWIATTLLINLLMVLSLQTTFLLLDHGGVTFAQTGPPDDTPTPIPTATPNPGEIRDIIIDINVDVSPGDGSGNGGSGGQSGREHNRVSERNVDSGPTPTFTPLPFTAIFPPPVVTETIFVVTNTIIVEAPPVVTPALTLEATPTPALDYSLCGLVSIAGTPPPGLPSLAGSGAIYQIPPAPGESLLQVTTNLGNGVCNCTLTVPTSATQCKIAEIDQDPTLILNAPAPLPASVRMLVPFNINLFGVDNSQNVVRITAHSPPLIFTTDPLDVSDQDKVVLLRYDEVKQQYKMPQQEYNPSTKILQAFLPATSFFVLGILTEQPVGQTTVVTQPDSLASPPPPVSTLPPTFQETITTTEDTGLSRLWLFLLILAGLLGIIALLLLLGGGKALMGMLQGVPPPVIAERDYEIGGLALALASQMPDIDPLIRIKLASLPVATSVQTTSPQAQPSTRLNLPSVEVGASIKTIKPGVLQVHQAVNIPAEIDLVSWSKLGLRSGKLSHTVLAGRLNWYGPNEIFARLQELEAADVIEIQGQTNFHCQYIIDTIQNYQADTASVVEISQTTEESQLVLIVWSEAYDIDQQEYRDYIVIKAHLVDASLMNRPEMTKQAA